MKQILYRDLCFSCLRPKKACFCELLIPFDTNIEFCILMHPKEAKKGHIGTGRMTNVAIKNCQIIIGENFDNDPKVQNILNSPKYFPMILYPGESSINLSCEKLVIEKEQGKQPIIFIIDGTWPCAKSMMRETKSLHHIQRISFDSNIESRYFIRHQPAKYCLSTIESVYEVLSLLESQGHEKLSSKKEVLLDGLKALVDFQLKCARDPSLQRYRKSKGAYKEPSERKAAKRWEKRSICFEEQNY